MSNPPTCRAGTEPREGKELALGHTSTRNWTRPRPTVFSVTLLVAQLRCELLQRYPPVVIFVSHVLTWHFLCADTVLSTWEILNHSTIFIILQCRHHCHPLTYKKGREGPGWGAQLIRARLQVLSLVKAHTEINECKNKWKNKPFSLPSINIYKEN